MLNCKRRDFGRMSQFLLILATLMMVASWGDVPTVSATPSGEGSGVNPAPPMQNMSVLDCTPCKIKIDSTGAEYEVRFKVRKLPDGNRTIEEIEVSKGGTAKQRLVVHDMMPVGMKDDFFLGAADINFDGFNDLFLTTSRGVANAYADYWLFTPSKGTFSYFGNYPIFKVDSARHKLTTYERGGYGGRVYEKKEYSLIDGNLTVVASEKQEPSDRDGVFHRKVSQRKGGKMRVIKTETIRRQ